MESLNIKFRIYKELQAVVEGLHFVLERPEIFPDEVYTIV